MIFEELGIFEPILRALKAKNYTEPTPIQAKSIPLILEGNDLLGVAQTGTGKTAAFAIPIIQKIQKLITNGRGRPKIKALIITPTRELAIQIDDNIKGYSKNTDVKHAVIFGGVPQGKQVNQLKQGVHILVATPGRLLDLISQKHINLDAIKIFVLDEADRMLDMGFIHDIKKLLKILPTKRQSLFFSATMPSNIVQLSRTILDNPKRVEVSPESTTAETIKQYLYYTNKNDKKDLLIHILKDQKIKQVLVFSRTKHGADKIARNLKKHKIEAAAIHGDKAQNQRQKALTQFKASQIRVLVATDIAARGIDIDKLQYVINYDIPNIPETYVHRIGRSGRAGEEGVALSLCEPEENVYVRDIEKLIKKKIDVVRDQPYIQTDKPMNASQRKDAEKEKQRKKQEFFANRKKQQGGSSKRAPKAKGTGKKINRRR
ncbi:DEAD/DEAH box helicase [Carboxylicivirga sp. N1Y90]|uniref:DEAD/DEAH box helicase n=1 Tax=Carboxylicivirga fragile TaxID=3417571 RepID=UPI003D325470|nr:DEAD/DEAH box helicase [Marinilabiliaceae bacterium N1Y90]